MQEPQLWLLTRRCYNGSYIPQGLNGLKDTFYKGYGDNILILVDTLLSLYGLRL